VTHIEVFDPPMCCSTGVCGIEPNPQLSRFTADLDWLRKQGIEVRRYNLAQEPFFFTGNGEVKRLLEESGVEGLPAILVDGTLYGHGFYPSRDELAKWTGLPPDQKVKT
jgi:hypothetical protein